MFGLRGIKRPAAGSSGHGGLKKTFRECLILGDSIAAGFYSAPGNSWPWKIKQYLDSVAPGQWTTRLYAKGGLGSIIFNPDWNATATGGPFTQWMQTTPEIAFIELSANNLAMSNTYDGSLRYDGTLRGYSTPQECMDWYEADIRAGVAYLLTRGITPAKIHILGQWPMGSDAQFDARGQRFVGGTSKGWVGMADLPAGENMWNLWNYGTPTPGATFIGIKPLAESLGCTFVDMTDVYGVGYNPQIDPSGYVYQPDGSYVHLTDAGAQKWQEKLQPFLS
ncbi:MAG: SGNH/GDSL hydrolase family protein [Nitrososphaerota archaeon]|nr:SGNH/GDSL hydrolase family protein [Nitrososphaerota archaeon]